MKKTLLSITAAALLAVPVMAEDTKSKKKGDEPGISGMVKLMHIVDGAYTGTGATDNSMDPSTGSALLANVKYKTEKFAGGLSAVINAYALFDTGLTERNDAEYKEASGMFINNAADDGDPFYTLGEAYLDYKDKAHHAKLGRQLFQTPLTTIKFSTMPSFYEGLSYINKLTDTMKLSAGHMTKMAYGARAYADAALIGENTGTAGATTQTIIDNYEMQGKFVGFAEMLGGVPSDSAGMTYLGLDYKMQKNLTIRAWDYMVQDIVNNLYVDADYKMPMGKTTKLVLGAQYLTQSYDYNSVTSDFALTGAKVGIAGKLGERKYNLSYAMNSSSGDAMVNVWGADPAYTSTIFSRNAYRDEVSASKISAKIGLMKGLKLVVEMADYGQSKTLKGATAAANDATETDIILVYKPNKKWMFKIFNAQRTSEYDDTTTKELKQNHTRMMATYKF